MLEVVNAYAKASGREIPYRIAPRRPGDVAACWADASRAGEVLGWKAQKGLGEMCGDSWRWQLAQDPQSLPSPMRKPSVIKQELHQAELMEDWHLAQISKSLKPIAPLE